MTPDRLVSTFEFQQVRPRGKSDFACDLRLEIFESAINGFRCRVWIVEEYRVLPTNMEYEKLSIGDPNQYADKLIPAELDALEFDEITGETEAEVKAAAIVKIGELFTE